MYTPDTPLRSLLLVLGLLLPALGSCASSPSGALPGAAPLTAVDDFDLERYLGRWYEIAKYPVRFEKGLVGVTAEYALRDDGRIGVVNSGFRGSFDGERSAARAKGWAPDPEQPAQLKVQFFWPFRADYWVIALDPEYRWAVIGEPKRRYLWILSRSPSLPGPTYDSIVARIAQLGYDVRRLEPMPQPVGPDGTDGDGTDGTDSGGPLE